MDAEPDHDFCPHTVCCLKCGQTRGYVATKGAPCTLPPPKVFPPIDLYGELEKACEPTAYGEYLLPPATMPGTRRAVADVLAADSGPSPLIPAFREWHATRNCRAALKPLTLDPPAPQDQRLIDAALRLADKAASELYAANFAGRQPPTFTTTQVPTGAEIEAAAEKMRAILAEHRKERYELFPVPPPVFRPVRWSDEGPLTPDLFGPIVIEPPMYVTFNADGPDAKTVEAKAVTARPGAEIDRGRFLPPAQPHQPAPPE